MSLELRYMRDGEEDIAATLMRQLPRDLGLSIIPKVTGKSIRNAKGVAEVTVAADQNGIVAVCLWTETYSSWRGMKGIYVSDLYVVGNARSNKIGEKLLRFTAQEARKRGAGFIKLEVDATNHAARRFYERAGFVHKPDDQFHVLEPDPFQTFIQEKKQ